MYPSDIATVAEPKLPEAHGLRPVAGLGVNTDAAVVKANMLSLFLTEQRLQSASPTQLL